MIVFLLAGICASLHLLALLTFLAAWYLVRRQECIAASASTIADNHTVSIRPHDINILIHISIQVIISITCIEI